MTYTEIAIHKEDGQLAVQSPFHPDMVTVMRNLNARFHEGTWWLDERDESTVRAACRDIYGTDGTDSPALVDLRVHVSHDIEAPQTGIFMAGRLVARAYGRDSGTNLGPGVVLIQGDGPKSGGSHKNWLTILPADSVLELRDIPRPAADRLFAEQDDRYVLSIVGEPSRELEALKARRAELIEELNEIDVMIAGHAYKENRE